MSRPVKCVSLLTHCAVLLMALLIILCSAIRALSLFKIAKTCAHWAESFNPEGPEHRLSASGVGAYLEGHRLVRPMARHFSVVLRSSNLAHWSRRETGEAMQARRVIYNSQLFLLFARPLEIRFSIGRSWEVRLTSRIRWAKHLHSYTNITRDFVLYLQPSLITGLAKTVNFLGYSWYIFNTCVS